MGCINFKIDELAGKLGNAVATELEKIGSQIAREVQIAETFAAAAKEIEELATNAVENFKNIASGGLPNLNDIADQAFSKITSELDRVIGQFEGLVESIGDEIQGLENFISEQIDCLTSAKTKMAETAAIQGGLTNNISKNVKSLTNNQLRDMQLQTDQFDGAKFQQKISQDMANNAAALEKQKAAFGKSFAKQAESQNKVVDNFDKLTADFDDNDQFAHLADIPEIMSEAEFEAKFEGIPKLNTGRDEFGNPIGDPLF